MTEEQRKMKQREYNKRWYLKNRDKKMEYCKKYNAEHKEDRIKYYQENKDKIYEYQTRYRHKNSKKVSKMVYECRKRKVAKLREQGVVNAWAVVNYLEEPRYVRRKRGQKANA